MIARRLRLTVAVSLCGLMGVLAFASAPATAKTIHVFAGTLTGSGANTFSEPSGIAVNNSTGDVYVVDRGNKRVEEFNPNGTAVLAEFNGSTSPTGAFSFTEEAEELAGIAIDNSTNPLDPSAGDVYVADNGNKVVDKFSPSGTYLGQITEGAGGVPFEELRGVAVDTEGKLWVYQNTKEIDDYSDALANQFVASRESPARGAVTSGLAIDSTGDLYVRHRYRDIIAKLNGAGEELEGIEEFGNIEGIRGIAVDPTNNEVYLAQSESVSVFEANGSPHETFGSGHLTGSGGIAVNYSTETASSGYAYVADSIGNDVAIFHFGVVPDLTVEPASGFTTTSVVLTGTLNPDNTTVTGCEFEYGTEPGVYPHKAACAPAPPLTGTQPIAVSATATGLKEGTTYYYRLSATNTTGTDSTEEQSFFLPNTVKVDGESSRYIESKGATLEAKITPAVEKPSTTSNTELPRACMARARRP